MDGVNNNIKIKKGKRKMNQKKIRSIQSRGVFFVKTVQIVALTIKSDALDKRL